MQYNLALITLIEAMLERGIEIAATVSEYGSMTLIRVISNDQRVVARIVYMLMVPMAPFSKRCRTFCFNLLPTERDTLYGLRCNL